MPVYVLLGETYVTALSKTLRRSVRREREKIMIASQQYFGRGNR